MDSTIAATRRIRVAKDAPIHVKRELQGKGKLSVVVGQEVAPHDILGESIVSAGFSVINLVRELGVSKVEAIKCLQRPLGSTFYKGELMALKKELIGKKIITSPTDCVAESYNSGNGDLHLKFLPKQVPMTAGVYGIVDSVDKLSGEVLIKTLATEIYGVLGSGYERNGLLFIINTKGLVHPSQISPAFSQKILIVNGLIFGEALRKVVGFGAHGIICGGLNVADYLAMVGDISPYKRVGSDVGISIIATEGFGSVPLGEDILSLIEFYQERFVFINGNSCKLILPTLQVDSILSLRKISLPIIKSPETAPAINIGGISKGSKVRIINTTFMGLQGVVVAVDQTPTVLESGISTYLLMVDCPSRKIKVAYPNVELIGEL